jgi:hypothetical protein
VKCMFRLLGLLPNSQKSVIVELGSVCLNQECLLESDVRF